MSGESPISQVICIWRLYCRCEFLSPLL